MPKIDEIQGTVTKLEDYWKDRNRQMLLDRDVINLVKPIPKTDSVKWMTNEPKVFYDTVVNLLSSFAPRYRMPLTTNVTEEEKRKMNKSERFLLGVMREVDRLELVRGRSTWLRQLAYWVCSGWYAVFTLVDDSSGSTRFSADIFDPITVYPEWDSEGLSKCARTYLVDPRTALAMAESFAAKGLTVRLDKFSSDSSTVKIANYWQRDFVGGKPKVYNTVLVGDDAIKGWTLHEKFKSIPILVGAVGIPERMSINWQQRYGENIIAPNRDMYDYENTMISLMATIMASQAYPNMVSKTRSGAPAFNAEDVKGYGAQINLRLEDELALLKNATTPEEANLLLAWSGRQRQKGAIPDLVYGNIPFELSGFAMSILLSALKYRIGPYLNVMQYVTSGVVTELLRQYKAGKFKPITLVTSDPKHFEKGLTFVEEFSREDVPETLFVDVTIPISSAVDKTQQMLYARQALQPPQLLSRQTLWDEVLDIQDGEQEYERIIEDQTLEMPVVKQIKVIMKLREIATEHERKGEFSEAQAIYKYIAMLEAQVGMTPQEAGGTGEKVSPAGSPPEMGATGGSPPDMVRAALGVGPPGLSRRPESPEERQAKQGGR